MNETMEAFVSALECRLNSEYHRSGYRASFELYVQDRMPEIMDVLIPPIRFNGDDD